MLTMAPRKKKRPMVGGPERHKACGMCDGRPTRKFRRHWRTVRRLARAPQRTDWECDYD